MLLAALLGGCGSHRPPPAPPPPQVGVVVLHEQSVPLTRELVGRLSAMRVADVRARAAGVLLKRLYKEGSDVRAGQTLFQIDPAPLRAALDGAEAALAQAEANATNAHIAAERARELIRGGLVSRSDLDNAEAAERSTAAAVQGQQGVTEGALVGQGTPTLLTTVEQIDPIYVNFDQPAVDIERLRRAQTTGSVSLAHDRASVELTLPDGSAYAHRGTLDFRDLSVDPATGAVALRALVPNPEHQLLPGMFVGVRLTSGVVNRAFLVPQAGVQRDGTGPYVLTVGPDDKVVEKRVAVEALEGPSWIVTAGLADGDRVIVSGTQNVRPGATVAAVLSGSPGESARAAGGAAAAGAPGR
ncbi:MAG: efflux RND transporter periplasmic adaptor subunit [Gammaproteobacteria bacterium]|nr:MAG: efflux RND transporter periplasmic adaptor subunit [Gammaproteobacteria bacterium]